MRFFHAGVAENVFEFLEEGGFHFSEVVLELFQREGRPGFLRGVYVPAGRIRSLEGTFDYGVVIDQQLGATGMTPATLH